MEVMKPTSDALRPTCNSTIHHRHLTIPKEAFEIRVIYIRAVSSSDMQKTLKITFPARDPKTCLQLNGLKIDPSEKISRSLNRHRADALMSESIYVNTDRIKFSGPSLPFEVGQVGGSAALVAGVVRRVGDDGKVGPDGRDWMWVMECREGGIKEVNGGLVDVYFAGRSLGRPLLLNGVVELKRRLKGLDCIPEGDEMAIDNCKDTGEKKSKELDENPLQEEEEETEMFTSRDEEELLEMLMNNCGEHIHRQVIEIGLLPILVKIVKKKTDLPVREKIFLLLDATQTSLGGASGKFPQYYAAYYDLVCAQVQFPRGPSVPSDLPTLKVDTNNSPAEKSVPIKSEGVSYQSASQIVPDLSIIHKATSAMEVLREVLDNVNPQHPEGAMDEFTLDLVEQCSFQKQRVMHLVMTSQDEKVVSQAIELNEQLQKVLTKHDTLLSAHSTSRATSFDHEEAEKEEADQLFRRI